jgi:GDP-D-mannose dehydratase
MPGKPIAPEDQRDFNRRLMTTLEELGVVYAIGGSVAAMMYSQPRLTIDVDVMVAARVLEAWRNLRCTPAEVLALVTGRFQIRFDSS